MVAVRGGAGRRSCVLARARRDWRPKAEGQRLKAKGRRPKAEGRGRGGGDCSFVRSSVRPSMCELGCFVYMWVWPSATPTSTRGRCPSLRRWTSQPPPPLPHTLAAPRLSTKRASNKKHQQQHAAARTSSAPSAARAAKARV